MSQETTQQNEHQCKCKKFAVMAVIALIFSIAALATSLYTLLGGVTLSSAQDKKVVISTQYDKGKSLKKALETKKPVIVFFYTDWCGYCQRFAPTYHKLSKDRTIKDKFAIAYVNCEKPENSKDIEEYKIQAFPTVFVVDKDSKKTQLDNNLLFGDEAVKDMKEKALEIIGEDD